MEEHNILAEHSYRELTDLLLWFYHQGPIPVLIGGWAVFCYSSYMGSVDIDLVGPSMGGLNVNEASVRKWVSDLISQIA